LETLERFIVDDVEEVTEEGEATLRWCDEVLVTLPRPQLTCGRWVGLERAE
jgi:hypothetical protein